MSGDIPSGRSANHIDAPRVANHSGFKKTEKAGSFHSKEVVRHPGETYIPDDRLSEQYQKTLGDWEIEIAEIESHFNIAAEIDESNLDVLQSQLDDIVQKGSAIIESYDHKINELETDRQLSRYHVHTLKQHIATHLKSCFHQLNAIKKRASGAPQKNVKQLTRELVRGARGAIDSFNLKLSELKVALKKALPEQRPKHSLGSSESKRNALRQQLDSEFRDGKPTSPPAQHSAEGTISSIEREISKPLITTRIQDQPETPLTLPSGLERSSHTLKSPVLQPLMQEMEETRSKTKQWMLVEKLEGLVASKCEEYRNTIPLFNLAFQKNRSVREGDKIPLKPMQDALQDLLWCQQQIRSGTFNAEVLEKADSALAFLDPKKEVPSKMIQLLSETLPEPPYDIDYVANIIARQLMKGGGQYLAATRSDKDKKLFKLLTEYHKKAEDGEAAARTEIAHMLDYVFRPPESIRERTGQLVSLDEIRALNALYAQWSSAEAAIIDSTWRSMEETGLPADELKAAHNDYFDLTRRLLSRQEKEAAQMASGQYKQLTESLKSHISEIAQQRLQARGKFEKKLSQDKIRKEVAEHLTQELAGLAVVTFPTQKESKEAIPTVTLKWPPEGNIAQISSSFETLVNQDTPALKTVREKLTAESHSGFISANGEL